MIQYAIDFLASLGAVTAVRWIWRRTINTGIRFWDLTRESERCCTECIKINKVTGCGEAIEMLHYTLQKYPEGFSVFPAKYTSRSGSVKTRIIVAFGESGSLVDLLANVDFRGTCSPHYIGSIHKEFLKAIDPIYDQITLMIRDIHSDIATVGEYLPVYVAGYSIGGALALLFTARAYNNVRHYIKGLYTFGSPRVGDERFTDWCDYQFQHIHHRWVNGSDPIPRVPIGLFVSYKHCGRTHYIHRTGALDPLQLHTKGDTYMPIRSWIALASQIISKSREIGNGLLVRHSGEQYMESVGKTTS